jgi:hypothetical protein
VMEPSRIHRLKVPAKGDLKNFDMGLLVS